MNKLNWIFTLSSVNVLLITIERFSPTTKILVGPSSSIRLHELIQGPIFLTISVILSFMVLYELTNNFSTLKNRLMLIWGIIFIAGVYLYGMGEGWHEVASFTFNHYCNIRSFSGNLCGGLFFNDYYTGNILFFIGGIAMNTALIYFQLKQKLNTFDRKNLTILLLNSLVYAFTFFAYAGFDRVLIGLYSTIILMIIADFAFLKIRKNFRDYPYITYSAFGYTLATLASIIVRIKS